MEHQPTRSKEEREKKNKGSAPGEPGRCAGREKRKTENTPLNHSLAMTFSTVFLSMTTLLAYSMKFKFAFSFFSNSNVPISFH